MNAEHEHTNKSQLIFTNTAGLLDKLSVGQFHIPTNKQQGTNLQCKEDATSMYYCGHCNQDGNRAIRSLEVGPGCIFCVVSRVAGAPHIDALVLPRLEALCVLVLTGLLYCDCG